MSHGGRRPGAGRKKGAVTAKTREIAEKAMTDGITPLEVMLGAMRSAWEAGDKEKAAFHAKDAAPYMHPRLASVQHSGDADNPLSVAIMSSVPRDDESQHVNGHDETAHH